MSRLLNTRNCAAVLATDHSSSRRHTALQSAPDSAVIIITITVVKSDHDPCWNRIAATNSTNKLHCFYCVRLHAALKKWVM